MATKESSYNEKKSRKIQHPMNLRKLLKLVKTNKYTQINKQSDVKFWLN